MKRKSNRTSLTKWFRGTTVIPIFFLTLGCEKQDTIQIYSVPRHESLQSSTFLESQASRRPQPARMLAAIVPQDAELWFFKLQGTPNVIESRHPEFLDFMKSVKFSDSSKPTWTLPSGWKEIPGTRGRFATLQISQKPLLELTVTALPNSGEDITLQKLNNINRWRGQLSLPQLVEADLSQATTSLDVGNGMATLIDISGRANPAAAMPAGMSRPMGNAQGATLPADHPPISESAGGSAPAPDSGRSFQKSTLKFEKPEEWIEVPQKQFQLARFTAGEGEQSAEIAVSKVGGDRSANINRWRGQIGLPPASPEELSKMTKPFEVDSKTGEFVELVAGEKTILGVMIPEGTQTWFIKLTASSEAAVRERERFESFSKSLKLQ